MEPFKAVFSPQLVNCLAGHLGRRVPGFDAERFRSGIVPDLGGLELKARAQLIADHLHEALPADETARAVVLLDMLHPDALESVGRPTDETGVSGWGILPLTMVVGQHGVGDFDRSLGLLREMTKRFSAEFGIRYFLLADQERTLATLAGWVSDPNRHVRRLVSEGTRPRLPWAMQLPRLMADPRPMLPLLARLRDDPEPYVRRSVANHLNDISKDHPALLAELAHDWMVDAGPERQAVLRHACRSLIKAGDPHTLAIFGRKAPQIAIGDIALSGTTVRMGEDLEIRCALRSVSSADQVLTVDYVLHLRKANGRLAAKVFKGANLTLPANREVQFRRTHRFREVTTRRHYPGGHGVSLRINGQDTAVASFDLEL